MTKSSALHLKISGVIQEHQPPAPFEFLLQPSFHLHDYIALIEKARLDPKIEGIFLEIGLSNLGWAQAEDLRDALMAFRSHGKWLVAYGEVWEEREFFLATTADEIYMPPGAHLALDGFAYRATFYSDLLTKYGVNIDVMAFGEYKSMADSFQKNAMPEPVREATLALLRSQEKVFLEAVANNRKLETSVVKGHLDRAIYETYEALQAGLLDGERYRDQIHSILAEKLDVAGQKPPLIHHTQYWRPGRDSSGSGDAIAVLYASGAIQNGRGGAGLFGDPVTGSEAFVAQLRQVVENPRVKAIVIRIDSPGGLTLASEVIWREIKLASDQGKPIIASMGNIAASGGYFLAMACDRIVAQATTVTGSIGVVAMRWDLAGLYRELSLNVEVVKTSPKADFFDTARSLSPGEIQEFHQRTEKTYRDFVSKAAASRDIEYRMMEKLARGRPWSGRDALEKGLVDELGSLEHAIKLAGREAGLDRFQIMRYPRQSDNWSLLAPGTLMESRSQPLTQLKGWVPYEIRFFGDLIPNPRGSGYLAISPYIVRID